MMPVVESASRLLVGPARSLCGAAALAAPPIFSRLLHTSVYSGRQEGDGAGSDQQHVDEMLGTSPRQKQEGGRVMSLRGDGPEGDNYTATPAYPPHSGGGGAPDAAAEHASGESDSGGGGGGPPRASGRGGGDGPPPSARRDRISDSADGTIGGGPRDPWAGHGARAAPGTPAADFSEATRYSDARAHASPGRRSDDSMSGPAGGGAGAGEAPQRPASFPGAAGPIPVFPEMNMDAPRTPESTTNGRRLVSPSDVEGTGGSGGAERGSAKEVRDDPGAQGGG